MILIRRFHPLGFESARHFLKQHIWNIDFKMNWSLVLYFTAHEIPPTPICMHQLPTFFIIIVFSLRGPLLWPGWIHCPLLFLERYKSILFISRDKSLWGWLRRLFEPCFFSALFTGNPRRCSSMASWWVSQVESMTSICQTICMTKFQVYPLGLFNFVPLYVHPSFTVTEDLQ